MILQSFSPVLSLLVSGEGRDTMDRPEATGVTTDTDPVDKSPEDFSKMSTLSMSPDMMDSIAVGTSITVFADHTN